MIRKRAAADRGETRTDWLDSRHTFSFGDYFDGAQMGFRALRVINDDRVAPGAGFPPHGHADMEIITCVLAGALEHKDSLGSGSIIRAGDVQRMSAGSGVKHSELNASRTEPVHFLQIWIVPQRRGLAPSYEQRSYAADERRGRLRLIASRGGRDGSLSVHQDVSMYAGTFAVGERAALDVGRGRYAWVQVADGAVNVNGERLAAGDGAAITNESSLTLSGLGGDVLVFDLA